MRQECCQSLLLYPNIVYICSLIKGIFYFSLSLCVFIYKHVLTAAANQQRRPNEQGIPLHPDDAQQVRQCLAGDPNAFEPLVSRYQNAAFATALNCVRDRADAQDIVQDAFVTAYCKLGQLRNPAAFGGWLRQIVANGCRNWLRARQARQSHTYPLDMAQPDLGRAAQAEHAARSHRQDVWDAVDRLPEHYRSVALMHYLSGMSYNEIAAFLGIPISTVRGRLQQSRIRLREALLPSEQEELNMARVDVAKDVQDVVCRIAAEQIHEVIPLKDADHIVLYCGEAADIEIREADGEDVILEGTKTAVGLSEEAAKASVQKIEILVDQVDNYLETGPHEGEVFGGTTMNNEGRPIGDSNNTVELWKWRVQQFWSRTNNLCAADLYPVLREHINGLPEEIRAALGQAVRVSILRKEMEDLTLPEKALTPDIRQVFKTNWSADGWGHGSVGYVNLTLSVPASKTVTVIRGRRVQASGLRASVNLMATQHVEVSEIHDNVQLFDSALASARNIIGKLYQRSYRYGGANWSDYQARRSAQQECKIEAVKGEVDIDVGRAYIEASDLSGQVHIYNRYGATRLYQSAFDLDDRIQIESCSGEILLFLKERLIGQANLTVNTLCGTVKHDPLRALGSLNVANDQYLIVLSTMTPSEGRIPDILDANFYLKTESGNVTIEKMK